MNDTMTLLDPTAETSPAKRERLAPPASLEGLTIGVLDIGKARGNVFCDEIAKLLSEQGFAVKQYAKPTNARTAPVDLAQTIATECDVVVEALSD
jgi:hypothetical protein